MNVKNVHMKENYNLTMKACYLGYITQAIVNNFIPLLFLILLDILFCNNRDKYFFYVRV